MREQFTWYPGAVPFNQAFRCGILILNPYLNPNTLHAAHFLSSLQVAGWLARLYILILLLRPVITRHRLEAPPEVIERIFQLHSLHALSAFAIQSEKLSLLFMLGRTVTGERHTVGYLGLYYTWGHSRSSSPSEQVSRATRQL
jgi:hypothetical protein